METEDKQTTKPSAITFHTKDKGIIISLVASDKINQHFFSYLHSVRSETQCHLSYQPSLVTVLHRNVLFASFPRVFNP